MPYSPWKTLVKALQQLGLIGAAASIVAVGTALLDPVGAGIQLPEGELGLILTALLAAGGRALLNWWKNRNKK